MHYHNTETLGLIILLNAVRRHPRALYHLDARHPRPVPHAPQPHVRIDSANEARIFHPLR